MSEIPKDAVIAVFELKAEVTALRELLTQATTERDISRAALAAMTDQYNTLVSQAAAAQAQIAQAIAAGSLNS